MSGMVVAGAWMAALVLAGQTPIPVPPSSSPPGPLPPVHEVTLTGGVQVVVVIDDGVPLVSIDLLLPAGIAQERPDEGGVADLAAELLRPPMDAPWAERLRGRGGDLSIAVSEEWTRVSTAVLSGDVEVAIGAIAEAVSAGPPEEVRFRAVRNAVASALNASDWPSDRLADHLLRGAARGVLRDPAVRPAPADLDRALVDRFRARRDRPDGTRVMVAGAVDRDHVVASLERHLGGWRGALGAPTPGAARRDPLSGPGGPGVDAGTVILVDRPGEPLARVALVSGAPPGSDVEWSALELGMEVFGGRRDGRLLRALSDPSGASLPARVALERTTERGIVMISLGAPTELVGPALSVALAEMDRMRTELVPPAELEPARGFLSGAFPLRIETAAQVASQIANLRWQGRDLGALTGWTQRMALVDAVDVRDAAARFLDPRRPWIVVVGDAGRLRSALAGLGPILEVPGGRSEGTRGGPGG